MSQSNKEFLEQSEIDSIKNLSHYQRTQLQLHGNILREHSRSSVFEELANEVPDNTCNDFQNHIYSIQNPIQ